MGFLRKSSKEVKTLPAAAPGRVEPAMTPAPTVPAGDPRLVPIAGVTIEQYASISKAAATGGADENTLVRLALGRGVESEIAWREAYDGWNARMRRDMQLATHFGHLYQAAGARIRATASPR
ncbi:MAG TPA: hypothetical protein VGO78_19530 [Acidimicrobiales bacterium]|nr:hypothetical protein [Acidimicrobiales bacterium]